jgi:hypothetical protein
MPHFAPHQIRILVGDNGFVMPPNCAAKDQSEAPILPGASPLANGVCWSIGISMLDCLYATALAHFQNLSKWCNLT